MIGVAAFPGTAIVGVTLRLRNDTLVLWVGAILLFIPGGVCFFASLALSSWQVIQPYFKYLST